MSHIRLRWLRIQLALGGAGAATWYAGTRLGSEFVAGAGVGLLVAALVCGLLGRKA